MKKLIFSLLSISFLFFASCKDKDEDEEVIKKPIVTTESDTVKVNKFIVDAFSDIYLWVDNININAYKNTYKTYKDPYDFFEKLRYKDDLWSGLTDDIDALGESFSGVETSYGYGLALYYADATHRTVIGFVQFVFSGSPAEKAGLKRGDILVDLNGSAITGQNYTDLYYAPTISISRGYFDGKQFVSYGESIFMTAVKQYNNPILKDTIIVKGADKIGYLCYSNFLDQSEPDLVKVFSNFKQQNVTDVVLDLRYNPGGYVRTSIVLSSILAPASAVKSKDIYQIQIWNPAYTQYFLSQGDDMKEHFTDTLAINMDLSRLYVLVSNGSASASEATIIALKPYMNVTLIGTKTSGKFVGGGLLSPDIFYDENYYKSIKNWGMYLMWFRYTNKDQTYFTEGLDPDIEVEENNSNLYPFGDEHDPLLGRAIAQITGQPYVEPQAARLTPNLKTNPELTLKRPLDGKLIDNKRIPILLKKE